MLSNLGESPRRSLRLSSRGRMSSDHSEAELPVTKRSKRVVHKTAQDSISPVVGGTGRKGRGENGGFLISEILCEDIQ